jgi:hypothetical protein
MKPAFRLAWLWGAALVLLIGVGCGPLDTFNPYRRIVVQDFVVAPAKQGQVAPESLANLKETSVRWIEAKGLFEEVADGGGGGPETLFVQPTVLAFRRHRHGTAALNVFTGVDIRGESLIDYRFYDITGRPILLRRIHARYMTPGPTGDATAEAAGFQLANLIAWHKSIRPYPPR